MYPAIQGLFSGHDPTSRQSTEDLPTLSIRGCKTLAQPKFRDPPARLTAHTDDLTGCSTSLPSFFYSTKKTLRTTLDISIRNSSQNAGK